MHFIARATITVLGAAVALVLLILDAPSAWADHSISIDPGAYAGRYYTAGSGWLTGAQAVSLVEGRHEIYISTGARFDFDVDTSGDVTSLDPDAATGVGNDLQFNTVLVTIDPGAFAGQYYVSSANLDYVQGTQEIALLPGLIARILRFIEKEQLDQAAQHLAGTIERVDGCALRGAADPKGKGQPNAADHIVDCDDQIAVYDLLTDALAAFP